MSINDDIRQAIVAAVNQLDQDKEDWDRKMTMAYENLALHLESLSHLHFQVEMLVNNIPIVLQAMGATPEMLAKLGQPIEVKPETSKEEQ